MVFKCCVTGCKGNYESTNNTVKIFRLPHKDKNPEERKRWIQAIPRENIPDTSNVFVCENHWPQNYETVFHYGKLRPKHPPSVFSQCVEPSQIPTLPPPPRPTSRTSASSRNVIPDEMDEFQKFDKIKDFSDLCQRITSSNISFSHYALIKFSNNDFLQLQSVEMVYNSGIPKYILKIKNDLSFESFHCGIKSTIQPLSKNHINLINTVSRLEVALQFLDSLEMTHKKNIFIEQLCNMNALSYVGEKKYSPEVIARAFEYFSLSRTLYSRLREDFELPSVTLLTKLTSKVHNVEDDKFLKSYFEQCLDNQSNVNVLIDEIYVKPQLTYQAGNVFGKAVNHPDQLATTVLGFMICSLFGGKKFLYKALPVSNLDADFQYDQTTKIIENIKVSGGNVVSILCDNNKVNQKFFGMFPLQSPWCTTNNIFLLFDYVHVLKSIRNNWVMEKTQELYFLVDDVIKIAKWLDILNLHKIEKDAIVKLSKLTDTAVSPKPIERQKMSTCLEVFCDETMNALKLTVSDSDDTVLFLSLFIKFFKIVNVKGLNEDVRTRDKNRKVITDSEDEQLQYLLKLADTVEKMSPQKQGKRMKELTKDTARAFAHTCRGMVDLSKHLLNTSHKYVCLGHFTSDPIEKVFGKLRQGSGGTYFINTQQILQKVDIKKTKLCLDVGVDVGSFDASNGHSCEKCLYMLQDDDSFNVFHNLSEIESQLTKEVKMSLVYIAGYVVRNDAPNDNDTFYLYEEFGDYIRGMNCGGLCIPRDNICQWVFYSYALFHHLYSNTCKVSICNCFMMTSDFNCFENVLRKHGRILANIFFNNYCSLYSPRSSKEPKLKVLKLCNE